MSEKPKAKPEKSKITSLVSSTINRLGCLLKTKQTAPLGVKNKTKNTESGIVLGRKNTINSKKDASVCDSIAKEKYSNLNDSKSSKHCEDSVLQKYDEEKGESLTEHLKSQNASCLPNNEEVEAIIAKLAITSIASENEVKLNNVDTDKSLNIQSESKNISLFSKRRFKSEPVDEYNDESEILFVSRKNEFKDSERLLNGHSNHQNITCLENRNIKGIETDKVDLELESESDDENIIERGPDKTPIIKNRYAVYPLTKRDQETAARAIPQNATFPVDIKTLDLHIELEKIIADIEIERRIAKMKIGEITNFTYDLFGPKNNLVPFTGSISNPVIKSQERKTEAMYKIYTSENFSKDIYFQECLQMYAWIQGDDSNGLKVIHYLKPLGRRKYRRTNLHDAVMNGNLEKTLCILVFHKMYHDNMFEINAKDNSHPKKTALDWAYETRNSLLIDCLKENLATRAVHITPINAPGF